MCAFSDTALNQIAVSQFCLLWRTKASDWFK
uniref:Uncharacterized protein n=1 Tax=Anguilla anguilla TaxID=7936 RepID=A0A0E9XYY2_ANGAN